MKIAYISTCPPRECGIATFNNNLLNAIALHTDVSAESFVIAITDSEDLEAYRYASDVQFVIRQHNRKDYSRAADYINSSNADICIIEHEFGIYGGDNGAYLLLLIATLQKPMVSILHTILNNPSYMQLTITREIAGYSSKVVVMSRRAVDFLTTIYNIPKDKIRLIEHGVPDFEAKTINHLKNSLVFKNRKVLFTFGLISKNKGLETVIEALPEIVRKNPNVLYVVLGATHPDIIRDSGEEYRDGLNWLATKLNVKDHLIFINQFVNEEELFDYLTAADIYITPYLNEAQITSGTLSYAVGAGAAIISTPYWHAQELLANNRGRLFDFKDADRLAKIVNDLFADSQQFHELKTNAYNYGLHLRWPGIGHLFFKTLQEIISNVKRVKQKNIPVMDIDSMPVFSLAHLQRLTDSTGIVKHAKYGIPNFKGGYCLDDNSRALIAVVMAWTENKSQIALELLPVYLGFIQYMQCENGSFRNFLSYEKQYLDETGSEDSFGRTIWALGYLIRHAPNNSSREFAVDLFLKSVPHFGKLKELRGIANTIIGLSSFLQAYTHDEHMLMELNKLIIKIKIAYRQVKEDNWNWFEEKMTYDNAILPLALFCHYEITGNKDSLIIGLESMDFLTTKILDKGCLQPVDNEELRQPFEHSQQTTEATAAVLMYFKAYEVTYDQKYIKQMYSCYQWLLGKNCIKLPLYDQETKGCSDGLLKGGVNRNQGAESTVAYWISHLTVLKSLGFKLKYSPEPVLVKKIESLFR